MSIQHINNLGINSNLGLDELPSGADKYWARSKKVFKGVFKNKSYYIKQAKKVDKYAYEIEEYSEQELIKKLGEYKRLFLRRKESDNDKYFSFGLVREVIRRMTGKKAYLVQIAGALALLDRNIIEMATGEGKSLTAAMAAVVWGWHGRGCHVITVNDYLAKRDAEELKSVYNKCELKVGYIEQNSSPELRKVAYLADVTYVTNKEITADFLRDRKHIDGLESITEGIVAEYKTGIFPQVTMRPLYAAVVDEADSVLIDEGVTPLIISHNSDSENVIIYNEAIAVAKLLKSNRDYRIDYKFRDIEFTVEGEENALKILSSMGCVWGIKQRNIELILKALNVLYFYNKDRQYIISNNKVVIVDEATGRVMPDREWRSEIHQLVSAKENVEIIPPKEILARLSFQKFFRLYPNLSGLTGTVDNISNELWDVYNLLVVKIPTNKPCIREYDKTRFFKNKVDKLQAVVEEINSSNKVARPCLVGTRHVDDSILIYECLKKDPCFKDIKINVLNAKNFENEAEIIAKAGFPGAITISTNMAGRGTDIKISDSVKDVGGLRVILTEPYDNLRVNRQYYGRASRQGDPGSAILFVSLEDEIFNRNLHDVLKVILKMVRTNRLGSIKGGARIACVFCMFIARKIAEKKACSMRAATLLQDSWLSYMLAFSKNKYL